MDTHASVTDLFARFCEALGKRTSWEQRRPGDWILDHNDAYGGYVIRECLEHGAVSEPFGSRRRSAHEMCNVLRFALAVLNYAREDRPIQPASTMTEDDAEALAESDFRAVLESLKMVEMTPASEYCLIDGSQYVPPHRRMPGASKVWTATTDDNKLIHAYTLAFDNLCDDWSGEHDEYLCWKDGRLLVRGSKGK